MRWNQIVKDYLTFTKKDRNGILLLLVVLLLVLLAPQFLPDTVQSKRPDTSWIAISKKLQQKTPAYAQKQNNDEEHDPFQYNRPDRNAYHPQKATLFPFDPNTASTGDWQKLGLRDKTIHTIQNYVSKGGQFRKPSDLQKIYGLQKKEFERLLPYISISGKDNQHLPERSATFEKNHITEPTSFKPAAKKIQQVDINDSDTSAWIALPGIGSKLAGRIVNFRNKLGGFHSVQQVAETYGVADSVFQNIKQYLIAGNTTVQKININTADVNSLKMHPYIKWNIANAIVQYRQQHGSFKSTDEVLKIMIVTQQDYQKIAPYLSVE